MTDEYQQPEWQKVVDSELLYYKEQLLESFLQLVNNGEVSASWLSEYLYMNRDEKKLAIDFEDFVSKYYKNAEEH